MNRNWEVIVEYKEEEWDNYRMERIEIIIIIEIVVWIELWIRLNEI